MNTNTNETNGTVENTVVINKRRGRPIDASKTKRVFIVPDGNGSYVLRKKGAPKPGSISYFVVRQRNEKSSGFQFNPTTMTVETETVAARQYKAKTAKVETTAPVAPTTHESAIGAQVTQSETEIVVNESQAVAA